MKLTVLLTTYNHEEFIAQALDGVLMQRTTFEFDVVVLEDGSTDRTAAVLKAYHARFPSKIHLRLATQNRCDNVAFMDAWASADATYVALLDGDDFWTSSTKLQRQVDYLEEHQAACLCFHNVLVYNADSGASWLHTPPDHKPVVRVDELWKSNFIAGCSPVLRRPLVPELPSWFAISRWGDLPLYVLMAEHGEIHYLNEVMGCYRLHDQGMWSSRTEPEKLEAFLDFCRNTDTDFAARHAGPIRIAVERAVEALVQANERVTESSRHEEWQKRPGTDPELIERLRQSVAGAVPPGAAVAVATHGDPSLLLVERPAHHLAPPAAEAFKEQLFAQGATGRVEVGWIQPGKAYEFRLYAGDDRSRLLAAVTVTGLKGQAPDEQSQEGVEESNAGHREGTWIAASPNPVRAERWPSATVLTWRTGEDEPAQVYLWSVCALEDYVPTTDVEAVACVERLRARGVGYLVIPTTSRSWIDNLVTLRRHLDREYQIVADDPASCTIYALHWAKVPEPSQLPAPAVSIVIPCFNQAHFLGDAIESALNQTFRGIEVIVVDDGSTDETHSVAQSYEAVHYVRQENLGLAAARNAGLAASRGRMCVFLDSDDRLLPNAVEVGVAELEEHSDAAFASGICTLIAPDGSTLFTPEQFIVDSDHFSFLLQNNYIWNPGSVIYHRWVLDCIGGFDVRRDAAADYDLYLRITRMMPVRSHGTVVSEYRHHGRNMSRDSNLMLEAIRSSLESQRRHVAKNPELQVALQDGIGAAETFYGDELLQDIRAQWARRMAAIEPVLSSSIDSEEREALLEELRSLYRWMLEVFGMRRLLQQKGTNEAELVARIRQLEASAEGTQRLLDDLRKQLERSDLEVETLHEAFVAVERAVHTHLVQLDLVADDKRTIPPSGLVAQLLEQGDELRYTMMVAGVHAIARRVLPTDAVVLVVSGGDEALVDIHRRSGWHFPQTDDGSHAKSRPVDAQDALAQLDDLRQLGARFLLIPATERCWLRDYLGLEQGLLHRGRRIWDDDTCLIFSFH